jgi:hypothetical protein
MKGILMINGKEPLNIDNLRWNGIKNERSQKVKRGVQDRKKGIVKDPTGGRRGGTTRAQKWKEQMDGLTPINKEGKDRCTTNLCNSPTFITMGETPLCSSCYSYYRYNGKLPVYDGVPD